jgi:hypothetical protein
VGGTYHQQRQRWDEHIQYEYSRGVHELRICLNGLTEVEIDAIAHGTAEFALVVDGPSLSLLLRFEGALEWSEAPFTIWRVSDARRSVPAAPVLGTTILLHVHVVDAATNILKAERLISLPPDFSYTLITALRAQVHEPYDQQAHERRSDELTRRYPVSALVSMAVTRCRLARETPDVARLAAGAARPELTDGVGYAVSAPESAATDTSLPLHAALLQRLNAAEENKLDERGEEILSLLLATNAPRLILDQTCTDFDRLAAAGSGADFRDYATDCTPVRPGVWAEWKDHKRGVRSGCALLVLPDPDEMSQRDSEGHQEVKWRLLAHFVGTNRNGATRAAAFSMLVLIDPRGRIIPGQPFLSDETDEVKLDRMRRMGPVLLFTALLGLSRMNTGQATLLPDGRTYVA